MLLILFVGVASFLAWWLLLDHRKSDERLPPGPRLRVPFLGQMVYLGRNPVEGIRKLRKKYGDVFYLEGAGVFVCDLSMLEEMFGMEEFSGRIDVDLAFKEKIFELVRGCHPCPGIISSQGEVWKEQRRFALRHLRDFGFGKTALQEIILEEFQDLASDLKRRAASGEEEVEVNFLFNSTSLSVLWRIVTGRGVDRNDEKQMKVFKKLQDMLLNAGVNSLILFAALKLFPKCLRAYDPFFGRQARLFHELFEGFDQEREEHERTFDETQMRDFMDVFIRECRRANEEGDTGSSFYGAQGRHNFRNVMFDLFMTGSETTSTSMVYVVLYCLHHPRLAARMREEVDAVVGRERPPDVADRDKLPYVEAFLSEIQRHATMAPTAVHHTPLRDMEFRGYKLTKNLPISSCLCEVMHDPANFPDPSRFDPTRFLDPETGRYRAPRAYVAFGIGRRECLGKSLAKQELFLFATSLLQQFTLEPASSGLPGVNDVDIGLVRAPKKFSARFVPRED